ncbi:hypothetical protein BU26DRAFT_515955 [Trematosphaeria pertusa]|uniref:Uncharacterized protein n=1 Tax=Trematosphaeria pertusa TaxID=390896 RepID=A0A6A6ISW5_9PLEO|nr:uncharacterized protein BU26DRAFT_515955 [Trematosphaeria pertusa]KAF2253635.1 hypothetical protein BU26DRAFT_515955 [Trematosphaeria pertusa]
MDPEEETPRMCPTAAVRGSWCDPPYAPTSKGSSTKRNIKCRACRGKRPDPKKPDEGDTGAGGSGSVQTGTSITVGA